MSTFATESKLNRFRSCSSKTGLIYLDLVVALREGYPECFFSSIPTFVFTTIIQE